MSTTILEDRIPRLFDTSLVANTISVQVDGPKFADGQSFRIKAAVTTTGATVVSFNGGAGIPLKKLHDQAIGNGDIEAGQWFMATYNTSTSTLEVLTALAVASPTGPTGPTGATGGTGPTGPTGP